MARGSLQIPVATHMHESSLNPILPKTKSSKHEYLQTLEIDLNICLHRPIGKLVERTDISGNNIVDKQKLWILLLDLCNTGKLTFRVIIIAFVT